MTAFAATSSAAAPSEWGPGVELGWAQVTLQGCDLRAEVEVTIPDSDSASTGAEGRLWLEFTVSDGQGTTLFHSGAPGPDGGLAGNNGATDRPRIEPHHAVILSESEVQIYERVPAPDDGGRTLKDNRLLGRGADDGRAATPPAMGRATRDSDFERDGDTVVYAVDLAGSVGPYLLEAALHYQPSGNARQGVQERASATQHTAVARISTSVE